MENDLLLKAEGYNSAHRRKKTWQKVVSVLATVVVFCTTYVLIIPAITWDRTLICEREEHTHTDECYSEVLVPETSVLSCEVEEHVHTDECFEEKQVLICGLEESEGHTHGEGCYDENGELICTLEEDPGHVHTEECWETQRECICEIAEHTHTEECFTVIPEHTELQLNCEKEEHTHTAECFDALPAEPDDGYYCGFMAHTHDAGCYYADGTLKCTIPVHEHTRACEADPNADLVPPYVLENEIRELYLGDNWAKNVVAIAESQLGNRESNRNFIIDENGSEKGYSRYGAWYGIPYGDWCAMFASFCIDGAGVKDFPIDCSCENWVYALSADENQPDKPVYFHAAGSGYEPKPGDLIFFDWDDFDENTYRRPEHVGIVYQIHPATGDQPARIVTIEGNWGADEVCCVDREADASNILGFGELPENPDEVKTVEPVVDNESADIFVDYRGNSILLRVTCDTINIANYNWQWQISPDGENWTDIEGAVGTEYEYISTEEMTDMFFRAVGQRKDDSEIEESFYLDEVEEQPANEYEPEEEPAPEEEPIPEEEPVEEYVAPLSYAPAASGAAPTVLGTFMQSGAAPSRNIIPADPADMAQPRLALPLLAPPDTLITPPTSPEPTNVTGVYYKRVSGDTIPSSTTRKYIIVAADSSAALTVGATGYTTNITMEPVYGNPDYYTITKTNGDAVDNNMLFVFNNGVSNSTGRLYNTTNSRYLRLSNSTIFDSSTQNANLTISYNSGSGTYTFKNPSDNYRLYYNGSAFSRNNTTSNGNLSYRDMIVLEQVNTTLTIPGLPSAGGGEGGGGGSSDVKPTDPTYITPTGPLSGTEKGYAGNDDIVMSYASDPGTSNIEREFSIEGGAKEAVKLTGVSGNNGVSSSQGFTSLFDGSVSTKYCVNPVDGKVEVVFRASESTKVTTYSLTTADDTATYGRLPSGWTLYGSRDNINWTEMDKVTSPGMSKVNNTKYTYEVDNPSNYQYYKIVFNASDMIQFSELSLVKAAASDNDGKIVVDKSVQYGNNDYHDFGTYASDEFSVTLSALAQQYELVNVEKEYIPVDVVIVLDRSGSMNEEVTLDDQTQERRAQTVITATNKLIESIMSYHEENRVGIVTFSHVSSDFLPLSRYYVGNRNATISYDPENPKQYLTYTEDGDDGTFGTNSNLRDANTKNTVSASIAVSGGTYTQHGIARGAAMYERVTDTTYTTSKGEEVIRTPLFIIISDGEPTVCTSNFMDPLSGPHYGNGSAGGTNDVSNAKGVLGYYTILSANYFKDMVGVHYNKEARVFTVGMGIYSDGTGHAGSSTASGDHYKRFVLNPDPNALDALGSNQGLHPADTSNQLKNLLENKVTDRYITIQSSGSNNGTLVVGTDLGGHTSRNVPVIQNPYANDYAYADGAYFKENYDPEALGEILENIVLRSMGVREYINSFTESTDLTIEDTIGDDMYITSDPVLRYEGVDYTHTKKQTRNGVTTYTYTGVVTPSHYQEEENLNTIEVSISGTPGEGQKITWNIPGALVPEFVGAKTQDWYYYELPARLMFKVGLTDDAKDAVEDMKAGDAPLVFYTNSQENFTNGAYEPSKNNPYYTNYGNSTIPKTENTTETAENSTVNSKMVGSTTYHATADLGNNGKLTFAVTMPVDLMKVDENGDPIVTDTAEFKLYSDAALTQLVGTFVTDQSGKLTMPELYSGTAYYLLETKAPYGYKLVDHALKFTPIDEDTVEFDQDSSLFFTLADDGTVLMKNDYAVTTVDVEKVWAGTLGSGESYPTSVDVQLYADGAACGDPVTLNASNGWKYTWSGLPLLNALWEEVNYTVDEPNVPSGYVKSYTVDADGVHVITNTKVGKTSLSVYKKWVGDKTPSVQVELLSNGTPTGSFATLNEANGWYYMWADLPDIDENGKITYSVQEVPLEGYTTDVHLWTGPGDPYGATTTSGWSAVSSPTVDHTYMLVYKDANGKTRALKANDDDTVSSVEVDVTKLPTDNDYLLWNILTRQNSNSRGSGGYRIQSKATSHYLRVVSGEYTAELQSGSTTNYVNWQYTSNHNIMTTRYTDRYMTTSVPDLETDDTNAAVFTLYEYGENSVEDDVTKGDTHYIIVNTKIEVIPDDIEISIAKVDDDTRAKLDEAHFALYRETGLDTDTAIPGADGRYGVLIKDWYSSSAAPQKITIDHNGTYYLVELAPPVAYLPIEEPIVFTVSTESGKRVPRIYYHPELSEGSTFTNMEVPNTLVGSYALPNTGGAGTHLFTRSGLLLAGTALMCLCMQRRRKERRAE